MFAVLSRHRRGPPRAPLSSLPVVLSSPISLQADRGRNIYTFTSAFLGRPRIHSDCFRSLDTCVGSLAYIDGMLQCVVTLTWSAEECGCESINVAPPVRLQAYRRR